MNTKENIRKSVASRFENFTEQERQLQSKKICEKIQSHPEFLHRETVVIYQPFPDEPDLQYLDFSDKHVIRAPQ